jgi:hypothetical protein
MDPNTKGMKQLLRAIEHIRNNFSAYGYEIVGMLGQQYVEGMKAAVSFEIDESLPEGERIITRVIKPQVNYQGRAIQMAQITVSQNN